MMPLGFQETALWQDSLAPRASDSYANPRAILATSFHKLRERAALLAAEIPRDLSEFTVHDVTHLDALWELADKICGPEVHLTPTEAYVLGAAFLIHDLGMGLAAWPGGLDQLKLESAWRDTLATSVQSTTGKPATAAELASPPEAALKQAVTVMLRERHAEHGTELALASWESHATGEQYQLIDDVDLRTRFGPLIGEIAASHGWDLSRVADRFGNDPIGAPGNCPDEWTVDALKLACIIRVADAAHVDERRAPGFLRAVRRPEGYSDLHWAFQGYLQRPVRVEDRLIYTSARAFEQDDAAAWWLCLDTLRMVNSELMSVDALLADRGRLRFAANGVKGVEEPSRLAALIPTSGWEPVNAEIRVTNVPELVRKLGGKQLYGDDARIALRELIQNARDSTAALRALIVAPTQAIVVRLERDGGGAFWLTVTDRGIGMSKQAMTTHLLDFGTSYWGSELMRRESVGLASSGFSSVGKFGIGFYSVFMLGEEVQVISRRYDEASSQTKVLEFASGLANRPIFRYATGTEIQHAGGTSIRVKLNRSPFDEGGLLSLRWAPALSLAQCSAYVAPSLDVDLDTRDLDGAVERVVSADDWKDMDGRAFLRRLSPESSDIFPNTSLSISEVSDRLRTIQIDGEVVARVAFSPTPPSVVDGNDNVQLQGFATIGGLNAQKEIGGICGVVAGIATTADRMKPKLLVSDEAWRIWATEQAVLWAPIVNTGLSEHRPEAEMVVGLICRLGADTGPIPVAFTAEGLLTADELRNWCSARDEITAFDDYEVDIRSDASGDQVWHRHDHVRINLGDNVLLLMGSGGRYGNWDLYPDEYPDKSFKPPPEKRRRELSNSESYYYSQREVEGVVIRHLATAWGCPIQDLLDAMDDISVFRKRPIGTAVDGGFEVRARTAWYASRGAPNLQS